MTDDPIRSNAIARRDAARAEARRWEDFLAMLDEVVSTPTSPANVVRPSFLVGAAPQRAHVSAFAPTATQAAKRIAHYVGRMSETEDAAAEIIRAAGRPVTTREMLAELARRGIEVGGKDPASTLSARLSRSPSLENHRPLGWRLAEPRQEIGTTGAQPEQLPVVPTNRLPATP